MHTASLAKAHAVPMSIQSTLEFPSPSSTEASGPGPPPPPNKQMPLGPKRASKALGARKACQSTAHLHTPANACNVAVTGCYHWEKEGNRKVQGLQNNSVKRIAKRKLATTPRPVRSPQCSGVIPGRAYLSRQTLGQPLVPFLREGHDNLDDCAPFLGCILGQHEDTPVPDSRAVDLRLQSRLPCVNRLLVGQRQNEEDERCSMREKRGDDVRRSHCILVCIDCHHLVHIADDHQGLVLRVIHLQRGPAKPLGLLIRQNCDLILSSNFFSNPSMYSFALLTCSSPFFTRLRYASRAKLFQTSLWHLKAMLF